MREIKSIRENYLISTSKGRILSFTEHNRTLVELFSSDHQQVIHSFETCEFGPFRGLGFFSIEGQGLFILEILNSGKPGKIQILEVGKIKIKEIRIISNEEGRVRFIAVNGKQEV